MKQGHQKPYQHFNILHNMCAWTLNAKQNCLLERAKMLPDAMEAVQGGYGLFILVDICLMLLYWLLHTYHAYFTFQVTTDIILIEGKRRTINIICDVLNLKLLQEGLFPAVASILIIFAEFSRVFLLSWASSK